jgi:cytochrome c-type biogenesis protein CcmH/NrfF
LDQEVTLLKISGIALVVVGGITVCVALLGAYGATVDMDPPHESATQYLWFALAGFVTVAVGWRLLRGQTTATPRETD